MAKILIAEDESDIRDLISYTLRFAGHQVIAVSNGEEAVKTALEEKPELLILDVRMPRMTGYEACKRIKSEENLKHIPVIFLSAKGQEAEIKAGLEAGGDIYMLKPFAPDDLNAQVEKMLAGNR
ncbi:MAG: response regulator [Chloroflexota bacterium]